MPDSRLVAERDELNEIVVHKYRCPLKHRNIALYCPLRKIGYTEADKRIILARKRQIYTDWVTNLENVARELMGRHPR